MGATVKATRTIQIQALPFNGFGNVLRLWWRERRNPKFRPNYSMNIRVFCTHGLDSGHQKLEWKSGYAQYRTSRVLTKSCGAWTSPCHTDSHHATCYVRKNANVLPLLTHTITVHTFLTLYLSSRHRHEILVKSRIFCCKLAAS